MTMLKLHFVAAFMLLIVGALAQGPSHVTKSLRSVNPGWWSANAEFPEFRGLGGAATTANSGISRAANREFNGFLRDSTARFATWGKPRRAFEFRLATSVSLAHQDLISVSMRKETQWDLARPSVDMINLSYGRFLASYRQLTLSDLFRLPAAAHRETNRIVIPKLNVLRASYVRSGRLREVPQSALNNFAVTSRSIRFDIAPGVVGDMSEGPYQVEVLFTEFGSHLNQSGPLAPVLRRDTPGKIYGEWRLRTMTYDRRPESFVGTGPTVTFIGERNGLSISGQGPVNRFFGEGRAFDGGFFVADPLAQTMMAGSSQEMNRERRFMELIQSAHSWSVTGQTLRLDSPKGRLDFLRVAGAGAENIDGEWRLITLRLEGRTVSLSGTAISLHMNRENPGSRTWLAQGDAPVNAYWATAVLDMNGSAAFSQISMTRRAGSAPMMDIERRYTTALGQVDRWAMTGGNLRFTKDNTELVFTKAPVSVGAIRDLLGEWELVSMRYGFDQQLFDRAPNAPTMTLQTASFSQTDMRVNGRGTINTYSSTAKADPNGTISLTAIAATKMGGSAQDMQAEQRFFEILAGANRWSITHLGLRLWSPRGELNFAR